MTKKKQEAKVAKPKKQNVSKTAVKKDKAQSFEVPHQYNTMEDLLTGIREMSHAHQYAFNQPVQVKIKPQNKPQEDTPRLRARSAVAHYNHLVSFFNYMLESDRRYFVLSEYHEKGLGSYYLLGRQTNIFSKYKLNNVFSEPEFCPEITIFPIIGVIIPCKNNWNPPKSYLQIHDFGISLFQCSNEVQIQALEGVFDSVHKNGQF